MENEKMKQEIAKLQNNVARKQYIIDELSTVSAGQKEMAIFTCAKKLSEYIFKITEKSPKKLRWSIISRLHNCSTDIIENLYYANYESGEKRLEYQQASAVKINLLDFYAVTAKEMQAINNHQLKVISKQIYESKKLLTGWIKSTRADIKGSIEKRR